MDNLRDIPFFASLSSEVLERVAGLMEFRTFPPFSILCRRGEPGRYFYGIVSGGVTVDLLSGAKRYQIFLGPGQVFGEMSLLADIPVTATVRTVKETQVYRLSKQAFCQLLESEPEVYRALIEMLVHRLRHRSNLLEAEIGPVCCFVVFTGQISRQKLFLQALARTIAYYQPGSVLVDLVSSQTEGQGHSARQAPRPDAFFPGAEEVDMTADTDHCFSVSGASIEWQKRLLQRWQREGGVNQVLILALSREDFFSLAENVTAKDAVVAVATADSSWDKAFKAEKMVHHGGFARVILEESFAERKASGSQPWCFQVSMAELQKTGEIESDGYLSNAPCSLDWLARWITRREVGLSLSAGAARGFAHLGVLEVLEKAGIPVDCLSGTSMGGVVALVYAMTGSASRSIELVREMVGGNKKIRDLAFYPKGSLYMGNKIARAAHEVFGDRQIGQLKKPCAVIAADLVRGERVVIHTGPAVEAALATSAIPGLFPVLERNGQLLTDGALMSRIPLDVLEGHRCGCRLAVNVIPSPETRQLEAEKTLQWLKEKASHFMGLRFVIAFSWELQAWTHGAHEAETADILIEPDTHIYSGYNFDRFEAMVEAGRRAAEAKLPLIETTIATLLRPGVP